MRKKVTLFALLRSPKPDWDALGLDPQVADDRLIARMHLFKEAHPNDVVAFMCNDVTPSATAQEFDILVFPPEEKIAPVELSSPLEFDAYELTWPFSGHKLKCMSVHLCGGDSLLDWNAIAAWSGVGIAGLALAQPWILAGWRKMGPDGKDPDLS